MVTRIRKHARAHLYIREWRKERGYSGEKLGSLLDPPVAKGQISKWEREQYRLDPGIIAELARALGIEPAQFYYPPNRQSLDAMVSGQSDDVIDLARDLVGRIVRRAS